MEETVRFAFTKAFFAEFLCVSVDRVAFAVAKFADAEGSLEFPAIAVKGIDGMFFDIATHTFLSLLDGHTLIPARVRECGDSFIFSTDGDVEVEYSLDRFRRTYQRLIVNSLLKDEPVAASGPVVKKNVWGKGKRDLTLDFSKRFWSKILHVDPDDISYGLIKVQYFDGNCPEVLEYVDWAPVLKIKGISRYLFSIDCGKFFRPERYNDECNFNPWYGPFRAEYFPAEVVDTRDTVSFIAEGEERAVLVKAKVYRHNMTKVANPLLS